VQVIERYERKKVASRCYFINEYIDEPIYKTEVQVISNNPALHFEHSMETLYKPDIKKIKNRIPEYNR